MSTIPALFRARFRSGFEAELCYALHQDGIDLDQHYECARIPYVIPARQATYCPDLSSRDGKLIIEIKGRFQDVAERMKYIAFRESHPDREIRFVLQRAKKPIYKGSKTTQEAWLKKNGFRVAIGAIPADWIEDLIRDTTETQHHPAR